ncbi:MAG TPA: alpha/beta hydrolase [Candidatus Micrarchaeaceae archaeon]|nr:alpha/beta hydrolase [Candidatus Micrarchaeaceae archaeon]
MADFLTRPWLEQLSAVCAGDRELAAIAHRVRFRMLLRSEDRICLVTFDEGLHELATELTIDDRWDFTLEASAAVWEKFLEPLPARHHHDLLALWMRSPDFRVDGDRRLFMTSLRVVRRLAELARQVTTGENRRLEPYPEPGNGLEPIQGRYLWLEFQARRYRVYFEEAGAGPPLLLLHTAGSDSRQYMHLLNDPELTDRWRLIAFDMPWHGRSMPPDRWWEEEYHLTTDFYAGFVTAFAQTMALDRPVVLGCSMGGEIVLELAIRSPRSFRAVIGCESADRVPGRRVGWTNHPQVNSAEAVPGWVDGLVAPQSPERHRREVWWVYSQSAAGVFNGDIDFFGGEWDARDRVARIDTNTCPVHLMTGEYDYSCTLELTAATAQRIAGARVHPMPGLGHFPVAENPRLFKQYLLPVLEEVAQADTPLT